jgi:hypothetical protein
VPACGSLHAHIVVWLHPDDINRLDHRICAYVPREFNEDSGEYDTPDDRLQKHV